MHLDDRTRSRLRALADATRADLDEGARERVARAVSSRGPRVMRRARLRRASVQVAAVSLVIGAVGYRLLVPSPQVAVREPRHEVAPPSSPPASAPVVPARACEGREAPEPRWKFLDGRAHVDLGAAGLLAVADGAQLWIDASASCQLRVRLLAGRVAVHAADLGGGELRVVTPGGDVVVHGTTFGVAQDASGLTVDVVEGRVGVRPRGSATTHMVATGQRLRAAASGGAQLEALPAKDRDALQVALGEGAPVEADVHGGVRPTRAAAEPAPRVPARTASELVAEADALWLRGERDQARERYRQAGALAGATAEAAWLALARRELSAGAPAAARDALRQYSARFAHGKLAAEADGIAFRTALQMGDAVEARRVAERLVHSAPGTAQAEAAQRWLETHR